MPNYPDDQDDDFETRRGRARSYAEERFFEAQRRRDFPEDTSDARQFDRGHGDADYREQLERDTRRSESMGTSSDRPRRSSGDDRSDYYRPPTGDSGMRYDRHYRSQSDANDYYGARGETGATLRSDESLDDYGRRRDAYRDEPPRNTKSSPERYDERDLTPRAGERTRTEDAPRGASRSHVRCRDIMTRDVTIATRDMTLDHIAQMMRDEDTGVIPVVEQMAGGAATVGGSAASSSGGTDVEPPINKADEAAINAVAVATDATPNAMTSDAGVNPQTSNAQQSNARRGERYYGKLVGLITDRDIVIRSIADGKHPHTVHAEEIMTTDVHTAEPNDRVIDAIRKMGDKQVRRIPVCDRDGNLRGIISMADVALETEEDRELAKALEEISSGKSFWSRMFG